jgi:hypothetical protein
MLKKERTNLLEVAAPLVGQSEIALEYSEIKKFVGHAGTCHRS